jgi:hypothetical protein
MEVTSNILPGYIIGRPTPSATDGVSSEEESLHRTYGCELVLQGGTVLGLPQVVIITGQNILNRFYYRYRSSQTSLDLCRVLSQVFFILSIQEIVEALRCVFHRNGVVAAGFEG